jgi:hypothetical protein
VRSVWARAKTLFSSPWQAPLAALYLSWAACVVLSLLHSPNQSPHTQSPGKQQRPHYVFMRKPCTQEMWLIKLLGEVARFGAKKFKSYSASF